MNKTVLLFVGIAVVLLFVVFGVVNMKTTDVAKAEVAEEVARIEEEYTQIRAKVGGMMDIEIDLIEEYVRLFARISEGHHADEKDYAQLLRTITQGSMEFDDGAVFSTAEDLVRMFEEMAEDPYGFGVRQIKIVEDSSGKRSLVVNYVDIGAYSIRKMDKDEKEHSGERLVEYDGSLGEYRIEIAFHGARMSYELFRMYAFQRVSKIKTVPTGLVPDLSIRFATFPDDSDNLIAYIGSDEPINIDEQGYTAIDEANGSIIIALKK
ncbi:MAG: hypothetical protein FWG40_02610 [Peptococcaceae bacterium]|nr:hypothetical protein [Peptococcaceae bacterium]